MAHQPFNDWLLDDERLTLEQNRSLRLHLRSCPDCAALARANMSLRAAPVIAPVEGFALRFQSRLTAQHKVERRRSFFGLLLLAAAGIGSLLWLLFPYLPYLLLSPARLAGSWVSHLVYIALIARTLGVLGASLFDVLFSLIPPYAWALSLILFGVLGILWMASVRKLGKYAQSAV